MPSSRACRSATIEIGSLSDPDLSELLDCRREFVKCLAAVRGAERFRLVPPVRNLFTCDAGPR